MRRATRYSNTEAYVLIVCWHPWRDAAKKARANRGGVSREEAARVRAPQHDRGRARRPRRRHCNAPRQ